MKILVRILAILGYVAQVTALVGSAWQHDMVSAGTCVVMLLSLHAFNLYNLRTFEDSLDE